MLVGEKIYSADDLWELSHAPEYVENRLELSEGMLIVMSPASGEHGSVASTLNMFIALYVRQHKLGYTTAAETGYILNRDERGRDTVRAPDVGFVEKSRLPDGLPAKFIPLAPDLAVEVVSPTDSAEEVQTKVAEYLRFGTRLVWVVYPRTQSIVVHTPEMARTFSAGDTLEGGDVLLGFQLAAREVFSTE